MGSAMMIAKVKKMMLNQKSSTINTRMTMMFLGLLSFLVVAALNAPTHAQTTECEHHECYPGLPLDRNCTPCVTRVCQVMPECCLDYSNPHDQALLEELRRRGPRGEDPWWDSTCAAETIRFPSCPDCADILYRRAYSLGKVAARGFVTTDEGTGDGQPHRIWCKYDEGTEDSSACAANPKCGYGTCDQICVEGVDQCAGPVEVLSIADYNKRLEELGRPSFDGGENKSVLVDAELNVIAASKHYIAYKTAFFDIDRIRTDHLNRLFSEYGGDAFDDYDRWMTSQWGNYLFSHVHPKHMSEVYAPIEGALVYTGTSSAHFGGENTYDRTLWGGDYYITYGTNKVKYLTESMSTFAGGMVSYTKENQCRYTPSIPLYVQLAFDDFNPRGQPKHYVLAASKEDCVRPNHNKATNFGVDVMMMSGAACLTNDPLVENCMRYADGSFPPDNHQAKQQYPKVVNLNLDPAAAQTGPVVDLSGEVKETTFEHEADDYGNIGLVKQLRTLDLMDTSIYVFREANGELLASRQYLRVNEMGFNFFNTAGLSPSERDQLDQQLLLAGVVDLARFRYASFIRGLQQNLHWSASQASQYNNPAKGLEMEESGGVGYTRGVRRGERIKVVLINHATGYIGTSSAVAGGGEDPLQLEVGEIVMRPPNLKIDVKRVPKDAGANGCGGLEFGRDDNIYQIGFEGKGLTSDTCIVVYTTWLDEEGWPLPEQLPGYTGRLAYATENENPDERLQSVGEHEGMVPFPVEPNGPHLKAFMTPQVGADRKHYYLHLDGVPITQVPNFSRKGGDYDTFFDDDETNDGTGEGDKDGAGQGALFFRPGDYVPFKVRQYDKVSEAYREIYRPEMQFTLLDLQIDGLDILDPDGDMDIQDDDLVIPDENSSGIIIDYTLLDGEDDPLDPFDDTDTDDGLIWDLDGNQGDAPYGPHQTIINWDDLDPNDMLVLMLIDEDDPENYLWEHKFPFVRIELEGKETSIPVGKRDKAFGVTYPEDMPLTWQILEQSKGVKVRLEQQFSQDNHQVWLDVDERSGEGHITLEARCDTNREMSPHCEKLYRRQRIEICCKCPDCAQDGKGEAELKDGVDFTLNMGLSKNGGTAGQLELKTDQITEDTFKPDALSRYSMGDQLYSVKDSEGHLRQVKSEQALADIEPITEQSYEISFYRSDDVSRVPDETTGRYTISGGAVPKVTWRVENPNPATTDQVRMTETRDGKEKSYEYEKLGETQWKLIKGGDNESQIEELIIDVDPETTVRTETRTISDKLGQVASVTQSRYYTFPWGQEPIEEIVDPGGANLTTTYEFITDDTVAGYGRMQQEVRPDGSWTRYHYKLLNALDNAPIVKEKEVSAWLDADKDAPDANARTRSYYYQPQGPDSNDPEHLTEPRLVVETVPDGSGGMVEISRIYTVYSGTSDQGKTVIQERAATPGAAYGAAGNLRTVTEYYPQEWNDGEQTVTSGKVRRVTFPDGRMTTYRHERGEYVGRVFKLDKQGRYTRTSVVHGTVNATYGISGKSTKEVSVTDYHGNRVYAETYVNYNGSHHLLSWVEQVYDEDGHLVRTEASNGTLTEANWSCCGKLSDVDDLGVETTYEYDDLHRLKYSIRSGIRTDYTYDGTGRQLSQMVSAGGLSQTSSSTYDGAGRMATSTDVAGLVTNYDYPSGLTTTVTRPGAITETTQKYVDGRTKSVTGNGVVSKHYTYGVEIDGSQWTQVNLGSQTSPVWEKSWTNLLGQTIRTEKPGYLGTEVSENFYNSKGRLERTSAPGMADTLFTYDELGNRLRTSLDINGNGMIDDTVDRLSESETKYVQREGVWWQETTGSVYAEEGNAAATNTGTRRTRVTGLTNGLRSESVSVDIHGNETRTTTMLDRTTHTTTQTVSYPDSINNAVTVSVDGVVESSTSKTGLTTTFTHDSLRRRTGIIDPRTGKTRTVYNAATGRVDYLEDPEGRQTTFGYDLNTGRKISETNALGKSTYYAYNDRGQLTHTWGEAVYPVKYDYDQYGRRTDMTTYQEEHGFGSGDWPAAADSAGNKTTWVYHEASGLLTTKLDAVGKGPTYTYYEGGKLATRAWARDGGSIVTTYGYNPNTGELETIDYSDITPDVAFTYDRLGRQTQITDAVGTRIFTYDANTLQPVAETITGLYDRQISRAYETSGVPGRMNGFKIGTDYEVGYGYDMSGRLNQVSWDVGGASNTATYSYLPNSELLAGMTTNAGGSTTYEYEPYRNLKTSVINRFSSQLISRYDYTYDSIGRRDSVMNSGQAFATSGDAFNLYDYNDRNELLESARYLGNDITDTANPVDSEYRLYNYDPIGNRSFSSENFDAPIDTTYGTNELNQYTSINTGGDADTPQYDEDGNMTQVILDREAGELSKLVYDAENRLIAVGPESPVYGDSKLVFTYDYMGRRSGKIESNFNGATWIWTIDTYYVYDGWNIVEEQYSDMMENQIKRYVWGLDLSRSLSRGGGVGGLVVSVDCDTLDSFYFSYDGNGNVGQLVDHSKGTIVAKYEYDAFGISLLTDAPSAVKNNFRFSTKYTDLETELVYYGFRYYLMRAGRWVSRDPIGEKGGTNLYSFVDNGPIDNVDAVGKKILSMEVRTSGESIIETRAGLNDLWGRATQDRVLANIARTPGLGFVFGSAKSDSGFLCGALGIFCSTEVSALAKFEVKAVHRPCGWEREKYEREFGKYPLVFKQFVSNLVTTIEDWRGNIIASESKVEEMPDGPSTLFSSSALHPLYRDKRGNWIAYYLDAPRLATPYNNPWQFKYKFSGTWRITANDSESKWESKIHVQFEFDDDAQDSSGSIEIISSPREVSR